MSLGLGIDTGGTYTDAAIIDFDNGSVISKAKALTTRGDLYLGIANSVGKLDGVDLKRIKLVSLSSTLATNSVVEGKGYRVGLMMVGGDYNPTIPVDEVAEISGGHNLDGEEAQPLDVKAARDFVISVKDKVDSFAISSFLSVRNPNHELELKKIVQEECGHPVICGHELSSKLGLYERTITAVLNARLIPIISDLVSSVKKVLADKGIEAPLMIVKGDGSLMGEETARLRPVETILSGPAASLIGARHLTGLDDAVVIDVGGTTTDIGILRGGRPRLDPEGAMIGGWRTRVKAADIATSGIGGDSRIVVNRGAIVLAPQRVVPLCIASSMYPSLRQRLEEARSESEKSVSGYIALESILQTTEFFIFSRESKGMVLTEEEAKFIELVKHGPRSVQDGCRAIGIHPYALNLRKLEERGVIQRIGLTPTDILHVDGSYREYDQDASRVGVEVQAQAAGMGIGQFCEEIREMVVRKIAKELVHKLIYEETGRTSTCETSEYLYDMMISQAKGLDCTFAIELNKPLIGVGAPVGVYLPPVAERLHTQLVIPKHTEVGNAVGAITGSVFESVEALIRPKDGHATEVDPPCKLFTSEGTKEFGSLEEAVRYAIAWGSELSRQKAVLAGAKEVEVRVDRVDDIFSLAKDKKWGGLLIDTKVTVTAVGKPQLFFEEQRR
jgi:N-methylhydantoinase A/oxoprolinase/acetone carboxylase beta subunit